VEMFAVSSVVVDYDFSNELRVEMIHFNSGVVVNFDVDLSALSRDVTILVYPSLNANGTTRNAAESTDFGGLVVMLWRNDGIKLRIDNQVLLANEVVFAVGL
jgi:hypothetical protein